MTSILLSLLAFPQLPQSPYPTTKPAIVNPAQAIREKARVRAFVRAVETDRNGRSTANPAEHPEPTLAPNEGVYGEHVYDYQGFTVLISPATGLVMGFSGRANHDPNRPMHLSIDPSGKESMLRAPREVSDDEARSIAARVYAATTRSSGILVSYINDNAVGFPDDLAMGFQPGYQGVPFSDAYIGFVRIDRETGELDDLTLFLEPPTPPVSVAPGVSVDDAHLVALRAAAVAGVAVRDYRRPYDRLSIALLDQRPLPNASYDFTPSDHADAVAGRARLVYDVRVGGRDCMYVVLVDAHDGRLLQVRREELVALEAVPGRSKSPDPLVPSSRAQSWRVAEGDAPWGRPTISTLAPAPAEGFHGGRKLLLTDGKLAFTALYDPATNLLGIADPAKGTVAAYRPGPALADLLRKGPPPALGEAKGRG